MLSIDFNNKDNLYYIVNESSFLKNYKIPHFGVLELPGKLFPEKSNLELFLMTPFEKIPPVEYNYDYPPIVFEDKKDAQECLEWIESLIVIERLT